MMSLYNSWRYYRLGRNEYKECMRIAFANNIFALRWSNLVFFFLTVIFSVSPIFIEKNIIKSSFYLGSAVAALILFSITSFQNRQPEYEKQTRSGFIYVLIILYYLNVTVFGIFLAVWASPEKIAGSFIGILICALFLFNISPLLYLFFILITLACYIPAIIIAKIPPVWNYDIQNALFAGIMSLIFGWQIIMNRITMISTTKKLKDETTIDELTQLKNRRDFMRTFQRFRTNHRQSDNFLCVSLIDIDWFKNYNDYYGHPKGDECLRIIGKAFIDFCKIEGIYAARVGGEEFALLWHSEKSSDAESVGLRINQIIRDLNITHEKSAVMPYITVSVGIYVGKYEITQDIDELYNLADKALYAAKNNGRNCTVVSL